MFQDLSSQGSPPSKGDLGVSSGIEKQVPRKRGRPKKGQKVGQPGPEAHPPSTTGVPASNQSSHTGTNSRPDLYLLGRPKVDHLSFVKLPKFLHILQRFLGMMLDENANKKRDGAKHHAADIVAGEVIEIWKHHFGIRVIEGKEYEGQEVMMKRTGRK